ncbi:GNAT family N-acetyltransferase [Myxococcota bacterium]|nr:GNAT family N-acetyltransferase [Myxococcota bacterium]
MLFGSVTLAQRIERAECELVAHCAEARARSASAVASSGGFTRELGGGLASFAGVDAPLTKVVGLGFADGPNDDELDALERDFAAHGAAVQIELSNLARAGLAERLTRRGYVLVGFENVLARRLEPHERFPTRAGIEIERATTAEFDAWLDVVVDGFAAPDEQGVASHEEFPRDTLRRTLAEMASARGFELYLARRERVLAGGASLHVGSTERGVGGIVHLCGAATAPAHRRRGVQGALLERRLADAARRGFELAVVTTLPGSKSQENVQRRGFDLVYSRAVLRRAPGDARSAVDPRFAADGALLPPPAP